MKTFNTITSALALLLSIVALCTSLKAFTIDSMAFVGWTIAAFTVLVAILMGWNFHKVAEVKEIKKQMEADKKEFDSYKLETRKRLCSLHDAVMSSQISPSLNTRSTLSAVTYWTQFVLNPYREDINEALHPIMLNLEALLSRSDLFPLLQSDAYNVRENFIKALEAIEPHSPDVKKYLVLLTPPK